MNSKVLDEEATALQRLRSTEAAWQTGESRGREISRNVAEQIPRHTEETLIKGFAQSYRESCLPETVSFTGNIKKALLQNMLLF